MDHGVVAKAEVEGQLAGSAATDPGRRRSTPWRRRPRVARGFGGVIPPEIEVDQTVAVTVRPRIVPIGVVEVTELYPPGVKSDGLSVQLVILETRIDLMGAEGFLRRSS